MFIARDRLGVKPLYLFQDKENFVFASELRAVLTIAKGERKLNRAAIAEYFRYQSIGFPFSPVEGIVQMEAGTWMRIKDGLTQQVKLIGILFRIGMNFVLPKKNRLKKR